MSIYSLKSIMTPESAEQVADFMVNHLLENCDSKSDAQVFDYDYQISQGKMLDSGDANTTYRFDTPEECTLRRIIEIMGAMEELPQDELDHETEWKEMVIRRINEYHIDKIKETVRSKIFKNIQTELVRMTPFELQEIEINPKPDHDFLIVVQRMMKQDQAMQTQDRPAGQKPVNQELLEIHVDTGLPLDEIIARKKDEGDQRYASVVGAYKRKYLYDVEMLFFVDYSLTPQEEFLAMMKAKTGQ